MKRKVLALIIALLALFSLAAAEDADRVQADLFDLYAFEGDGMRWVGTAVPLMDGLLVTPASIGHITGELVISDGNGVWDAEMVYTEPEGQLSVVFYDEEEHAPAHGSYQMPMFMDDMAGDSLYVRSGDRLGSRINRSVKRVSAVRWQDQDCLMVILNGPAEIGSALLTDGNDLIGILTAQYAEGEYRYIALATDSIYSAVAEAASHLDTLTGALNGPEGFRVTLDANLATFDWSEVEPAPLGEGESLYMVVADIGNSFLNYYPTEDIPGKNLQVLLTPGRTYVSGLVASTGAPDDYPVPYTMITLPEAEALTDYGFRSLACAIAEAPEGGEMPVPVSEVTEELLRSGRAYFYSSSTYDVEETIDDLTLLVTLTTPNGENYRYITGWIYGPEYEDEDIWYIELSETGLLRTLNVMGYPEGEYEMAFYVGGKLGDRFTFELH